MASNPPGQCCTVGVTHEGEAKGEYTTIGDNVETYISHAPDRSTKHGILLLTDVIGHRFINAQLIADQLAANGYFVVVPDLFHGDPVKLDKPEGFDLMEWLKGHGTDQVDPVTKAGIQYLKKSGSERIGAVGYCFGAKYVARFMAGGADNIDVGYVAHPSFIEKDELSAIKGPFSIAAAETDSIFPTPKRHESEEILAKVNQPYQINLFSGVEHGFAVRGDMDQPQIKFGKEQAFIQAVQWFKQWM